jgi:hypothetical protein
MRRRQKLSQLARLNKAEVRRAERVAARENARRRVRFDAPPRAPRQGRKAGKL